MTTLLVNASKLKHYIFKKIYAKQTLISSNTVEVERRNTLHLESQKLKWHCSVDAVFCWVGVDASNMRLKTGRAGQVSPVAASLSPQGVVQQLTITKCHLTEDKCSFPAEPNMLSYPRRSEECFRKLWKKGGRAKKQRNNNRYHGDDLVKLC